MFYQYNHLGSPDYIKIESGTNFSFPAHLHQCFEIITVFSGEMTVTVSNERYLLNSGDAILIFPNQIHALESVNSEHTLCIFSPRLVQAYSTKVYNKLPSHPVFHPDPYLLNALAAIDASSSSFEKKGVLYSLCAQLDKNTDYKKSQADSEELLYKIFSFVEECFCNECSLSSLAERIGYDYSYLSRYFKKTTGISFNAYVTHYRISHACYLMENTTMPIIRCAYDSGFKSLRSFNRCFKENLNITPTQYRSDNV